jgi:dihydrofolate synthase/folylpolyglutamate synthase
LKLLGSPQDKLKVIHIAGTSGKGSTCYLISRLLAAHGFKVGLHLSPHLTDVRERFQLNNKMISKRKFVFYLNQIIPVVNQVEKSKYRELSYFEILVGLAFHIFFKERVDYAVMETGLGGWYDATNVVDRADKLAVITKIGYDHTKILGKTLAKIALQKAMIIHKNNLAISINQKSEAAKVIKKVAEKNQAKLYFITAQRHREFISGSRNEFGMINIHYQKENISLALEALKVLARRDRFIIDNNKVNKALLTAHFPGRFDVKKINGKTVIFDGAHNPQKMKALTKSLTVLFPKQKFNFLLAFKKGKDFQAMLNYIVSHAEKIIASQFMVDSQDSVLQPEKPEIIGEKLGKIGYKNYEIIDELDKAFQVILDEKEKIIVVTGSLYLLSSFFNNFKKFFS